MPNDASNMPNSRQAIYRSGGNADDKLDTTLKIENMLLEEFNYAGITAYQAMEDRARMFNFYLLLVSVIMSGLGAVYQFGGRINIYLHLLSFIFLLIAGIMGTAFFVKLIRLRQAWRESVICMNVIKEFYIQQFQQQMPQVNHAFRWRLKTIPAGEHRGSTTFIVCFTIAMLESASFAGAAFIISGGTSFLFGNIDQYIVAMIIFAGVLFLNFMYYQRSLNVHDEMTAIQEQAKEVEVIRTSVD